MRTVKKLSFAARTIREVYQQCVDGGIKERKIIVNTIQKKMGSRTKSYIYKIIREEFSQ